MFVAMRACTSSGLSCRESGAQFNGYAYVLGVALIVRYLPVQWRQHRIQKHTVKFNICVGRPHFGAHRHSSYVRTC